MYHKNLCCIFVYFIFIFFFVFLSILAIHCAFNLFINEMDWEYIHFWYSNLIYYFDTIMYATLVFIILTYTFGMWRPHFCCILSNLPKQFFFLCLAFFISLVLFCLCYIPIYIWWRIFLFTDFIKRLCQFY